MGVHVAARKFQSCSAGEEKQGQVDDYVSSVFVWVQVKELLFVCLICLAGHMYPHLCCVCVFVPFWNRC